MGECICNGCLNLKGIVDDSGAVDKYECEFGFPSDKCTECNVEDCDLACTHFMLDDEEVVSTKVQCVACGKELDKVCGDSNDGDVYCINCYLQHNS